MSSCFELIKDTDGKLSFALKNGGGETILTSNQLYFSRSSALSDVEAVQKNCALDYRYDKKDSNGDYYFDLRAPNGHVIATSVKHGSAESRDAGIASAMSNGATKTVNL